MNILAIIPARYASSRLPGKPLLNINGKPMIQRVYEQASKAFEYVCVATDDSRIFDAVTSFGGKAVMTSNKHNSGTDRCLEALKTIEKENNISFDIVINVQGDEPYIHPEQLKLLAESFNEENVEIATLVKRVGSREEFMNPNVPKVIVDTNGYALYFSRAPIPYLRDGEITNNFIENTILFRQIGLYGYRCPVLEKICAIEQSLLEKTEKLEQLRWLEHGYRIKVAETNLESFSVDTPDDLECIRRMNFDL